ncbi:MAG: HNH endonuclease [Nitrospirae bacterium]|nr:HNH endonuclease [Nitrospirota bacterium]
MYKNIRVLVLNQTYEPLHFCNAKRAIVMLLKGRAEKIESDGMVVRSPTVTIKIPSVIRLMRYIKRSYHGRIAFSKRNVFRRDDFTCQYCGSREGTLTIDHVIPRSHGGESCWENMVVACQRCNLKKGDQTLKEASMRLLRRPTKPSFLFHKNIYRSMPESFVKNWNKYLPDDVTHRMDKGGLQL